LRGEGVRVTKKIINLMNVKNIKVTPNKYSNYVY
jgi:hypothetical protein